MAKRKSSVLKYNRIAEILEAQSATQSWLAKQLKVEYLTVHRYVRNHRQPSIEILFEIAEILNVSPRELLNESV